MGSAFNVTYSCGPDWAKYLLANSPSPRPPRLNVCIYMFVCVCVCMCGTDWKFITWAFFFLFTTTHLPRQTDVQASPSLSLSRSFCLVNFFGRKGDERTERRVLCGGGGMDLMRPRQIRDKGGGNCREKISAQKQTPPTFVRIWVAREQRNC